MMFALLIGACILYYKQRPVNDLNSLAFYQRLGLTNVNKTHSVCFQQYFNLNLTREIECKSGKFLGLEGWGLVPINNTIFEKKENREKPYLSVCPTNQTKQ